MYNKIYSTNALRKSPKCHYITSKRNQTMDHALTTAGIILMNANLYSPGKNPYTDHLQEYTPYLQKLCANGQL